MTTKFTYYDINWEKEFSWVCSVPESSRQAKCKLCNKIINLSNMGKKAITSHLKSAGHIKLSESKAKTKTLDQFLSGTSETPSSSSSAGVNLARRAEALWLFHMVLHHQSFRSTSNLHDIFSSMFPDSEIAGQFSMGYDKASYLTVFGLEPYFRQVLNTLVAKQRFFSLSFDESLNKSIQENQMDLHIRFWDDNKNMVVTRYLNSQFLGHSRATDLVSNLLEGLKPHSLQKVAHISMDGPSVNWKLYRDIDGLISEGDESRLLETGSCGLHIIHNIHRKGINSVDWNLEQLMRVSYNLFKDAPAKREDFITLTGCHAFPLKYCGHRWLENLPVASRLVSIFNELKMFVPAVERSKDLLVNYKSNNNFITLKSLLHDPLLLTRLHFFISLATPFTEFLTVFQSDQPLMPFLSDALVTIFKSVLRRFVAAKDVDSLSANQLAKLDLNELEILPFERIDIGTAAKSSLLTVTSNISPKAKLEFRNDCCVILKTLVTKMSVKSPLHYKFVRCCKCLDPKLITTNPEAAENLFDHLVTYLYSKKRLTSSECDLAKVQFHEFTTITTLECRQLFEDFKQSTTRLDTFYNNFQLKSTLFMIIKMVLTAFHGNANVERGFKINKDILVSNLQSRSLKALRFVHDSLISEMVEEKISSIPVTAQLVFEMEQGRKRYREFLNQKNNSEQSEVYKQSLKRKNEVKSDLLHKKAKLERDFDVLVTDADELARRAEAESSMDLIVKSNALRKASDEKKNALKLIVKQINELKNTL
jgi:hypothetical protein